MEQLNKIEIRGIVGSVYVKDFTNAKVANISVATNYSYNAKDGGIVVETTWHNVVAWEGKDIQNLEHLKKGDMVYVSGRLRNRKYTTADGVERLVCDIVANKLEVLEQPSQRV